MVAISLFREQKGLKKVEAILGNIGDVWIIVYIM